MTTSPAGSAWPCTTRWSSAAHRRSGRNGYRLTPSGEAVLTDLGVATATARAARRQFARPCLDFTARRPHLAGALGAGLYARLVELEWLVRRVPGQRPLRITGAGRVGFAEILKLDL